MATSLSACFVVARMKIFSIALKLLCRCRVVCQFNRVTWHLHLREPCAQGWPIRNLHIAYNLSLRQVEKTSIRLHRWVVLGGLCNLVDPVRAQPHCSKIAFLIPL